MSQPTHVPKLLTIREVSRLTGLATWRIYELLASGHGPPFMRIGRTYRFSEHALAEWIEEQHTTSSREEVE